jgi:hypothetical protein
VLVSPQQLGEILSLVIIFKKEKIMNKFEKVARNAFAPVGFGVAAYGAYSLLTSFNTVAGSTTSALEYGVGAAIGGVVAAVTGYYIARGIDERSNMGLGKAIAVTMGLMVSMGVLGLAGGYKLTDDIKHELADNTVTLNTIPAAPVVTPRMLS